MTGVGTNLLLFGIRIAVNQYMTTAMMQRRFNRFCQAFTVVFIQAQTVLHRVDLTIGLGLYTCISLLVQPAGDFISGKVMRHIDWQADMDPRVFSYGGHQISHNAVSSIASDFALAAWAVQM